MHQAPPSSLLVDAVRISIHSVNRVALQERVNRIVTKGVGKAKQVPSQGITREKRRLEKHVGDQKGAEVVIRHC